MVPPPGLNTSQVETRERGEGGFGTSTNIFMIERELFKEFKEFTFSAFIAWGGKHVFDKGNELTLKPLCLDPHFCVWKNRQNFPNVAQ